MSVIRFRPWGNLVTQEFEGLDPERTIAVLPVAAIEQHGPHLPVSTDTEIAQGMLREVATLAREAAAGAPAAADIEALVLPVQAIGKSNEHLRSPGTLTLDAGTALAAWTSLGESVARAGLRKLVMVNSHGGNADVLNVVARELRIRCRMLAVTCAWRRFGLPSGLYSAEEEQVGIHAGDIETSLMLHFRPDLVRMEAAAHFRPASVEMAERFAHLRPTGFTAFGWIAQDLHPSGAAGDASLATAEKGAATARHQARAFLALLDDVAAFALDRLA